MTGFFRYSPDDGVQPEEGEVGPSPEVAARIAETIQQVEAAIKQRMAGLLRQVYYGTDVTGHLADGREYTVKIDSIDITELRLTFTEFKAEAEAPDGN